MKLVEDWKESYTWLSVHAAGLITVINALQATVPQIQALLSPTQVLWINSALGIAVIWARLIAQGAK